MLYHLCAREGIQGSVSLEEEASPAVADAAAAPKAVLAAAPPNLLRVWTTNTEKQTSIRSNSSVVRQASLRTSTRKL